MAGKKGKKSRGIGSLLFSISARSAMLMNGSLLILSYLSMYVNPAKAWFMTVFGILFFPLFIINFLLLLWAFARRSRAAVIPILALLPSLLLIDRYIRFTDKQTLSQPSDLKIVSYNVGKFAQAGSDGISSEAQCADSVFAYLRASDADIICLQEFHYPDSRSVKQYLEQQMKGYNAVYYINIDDNGAYGNVTLSRHPVLRKGKFDFDHSSNQAIYTDYKIGGESFRVYNCHFESYNISIPGLLSAFTKKDDESVNKAEQKMRASITKRPEQVNLILQDIRNAPVESLVAGDFNDTPMSFTYNKLRQGRKDSFVEAGRGMGGTYSILRPFIRIDYVLFPEKWTGVKHKVRHLKYSDHYPVEALMKLKD